MGNRNIKCSKQLANDPQVPAPKFNFTEYTINKTYHNNPTDVDFVAYNGSLYVCTEDSVYATKSNLDEQSGFLCVVRKGNDGRRGADGRDGRPGPLPEIGAKFEGTRLVVYEKNGTRLSSSPDLTGPAWVPVLSDDETKITWTTQEGAVPSDVPLDKILPRNEYPVLFRLNSDNTKRSDEETGPGYYIQWKREGAQEWTNLMSISELMNLALAGVSFWTETDPEDGKDYIHFGHKQVVKATYDSSKLGNKKIAEVVLGDILFDAGKVPFPEIPDYDSYFELVNNDIRTLRTRLETLRLSIPTRVGQLENDVPYIKSINNHRPDNNGELKVMTINHQDIIGNIGNIDIEGGGVKSVNGILPDPETGDVTITVGGSIDLTPYVRKSDLATINNQLLYNGGNITVGGGSGSGLDDVEVVFDANTNKLKYRKRQNGSWGSYTDITTISPSSTGEHVELQITQNGMLQIKYGNGNWQDVGEVGGSGDANAFVDVSRNQNILTFTKANGQTKTVTLPSGGNGEGCEYCWTEEEIQALIDASIEAIEITTGSQVSIQRTVNSGTKIATITINGVSTDLYAPTSISGSTVTFEQILGSGTKIGTITIDGTSTDIYAPNGGNNPGDNPTTGSDVGYNTFMVYQRTNSPTVAPATNTITAAVWNTSTNELDLTSQYWSNHPGNATGVNDSCLWMTCATFRSDTGSRVGNWQDPVCLTSRFGDGADSNLKEFIYRSVTNAEYAGVMAVRPVGRYDNDANNDNDNYDDNIPASDNLATRQWTDTPIGISPEYPYELCAVRKKVNGVWQQYSMPFVWSRWGEDGVDGDGVEYVFRTAVASEVTESSSSIVLKQSVSRPNNSWAYDSPVSPWTDEPSGVSSENPYEFCSLRKTVVVNNAQVWGSWSEPALWSIYKEGPRGQQGSDGVTVTSQTRYYKASNQSTGVTAPSTSADPTLAANGSWSTSSNMIQLNAEVPYLWFFERIVYSNNNIYQSTPVIIRYVNAAANVNYQEIEANVLEAIGDDLDDLDERLSKVVDTNGDIVVDGQNGLVSIITNYTDSNQKSFADIIADAAEAKIKNFAGSAVADGLGRQSLTSVKNELDGIDGKITTAATNARQGAVSDARTEWSAADATITTTATKAQYVWMASDGSILEYSAEDASAGRTTKTSGGKTYSRTLVANAMSAIEQKADKVSIVVGQNGDVKADIIVQAINETTGGSTVQIDADHIVLNGDAIANAITAKYANVGGGAVVLDANGLQAVGANIEGTITATAGTFGGNNGVKITQNGVTLGSDCSIDWDCVTGNKPSGGSDINSNLVTKINQWSVQSDTIVANNLKAKNIDAEYFTVGGNPISSSNRLNIGFANGAIPANPDNNTIYFVY